MERCAFRQISYEEKRNIFLSCEDSEEFISIILFDNGNAWISQIKKTNLQHFAKEHKLSLNDYCKQLLDYLKNEDQTITFSFNEKDFVVNKTLNKSFSIKFFETKVTKEGFAKHAEKLLINFYSKASQLSDKVDSLTLQNDQISKEKEECENRLKALIAQSVKDQDEQMSNFIQILNEKKRRILHLTELLNACKNGSDINTMIPVNRKRKPNAAKVEETISNSENSETEELIDNDENETDDDSTQPTQDKVSTSKNLESLDFLEDDGACTSTSHLLPKRIKTDTQIQQVIIKTEEKVEKEKEPEKPKGRKRNKSPEIDLSTQQLLDML